MVDFIQLINRLLDPSEKTKAILLILITLLIAILDVVSLASIIPVVGLVFNQESINDMDKLKGFLNYVDFVDKNYVPVIMLLVLVLIFMIKNVLSLMLVKEQSRFSFMVATNLSSKLFDVYFEKSLSFFKSNDTFLLMRNLTTVPTEFSTNILLPVLNIITEGMVVILIALGIFFIDPKVLLISVACFLPAYIGFYQFSKRKMAQILQERSLNKVKMNGYVSESVKGFQDLMLKNKEKFFKQKYLLQFENIGLATAQQNQFIFAPMKIMEILAVVSLLCLVFYFLYLKIESERVMVLLSVFMASAYRMIPSSNKIINGLSSIKMNRYVLDIYDKELANEMVVDEVESEDLSFQESIFLDQISYSYPDNVKQKVLSDFSLKIAKGQIVGIVGESGSGKTTLLNILLGFLEVTGGKVLVDNHILGPQTIRSFRKKIGFVRQSIFILKDSIRANVAFGENEESINDQKVVEALKMASLSDWFKQNGEDLSINLGEDGANLSGGQIQRVAISRALYNDCELLVFDEATSALDHQTEEMLNQSILKLKEQNLTMVIVAHRYSSLKHCDVIYELSNGKIKDSYTFQELMLKHS